MEVFRRADVSYLDRRLDETDNLAQRAPPSKGQRSMSQVLKLQGGAAGVLERWDNQGDVPARWASRGGSALSPKADEAQPYR